VNQVKLVVERDVSIVTRQVAHTYIRLITRLSTPPRRSVETRTIRRADPLWVMCERNAMSLPSRPHDNDLTRAGWVVVLGHSGRLIVFFFLNTHILSSLLVLVRKRAQSRSRIVLVTWGPILTRLKPRWRKHTRARSGGKKNRKGARPGKGREGKEGRGEMKRKKKAN